MRTTVWGMCALVAASAAACGGGGNGPGATTPKASGPAMCGRVHAGGGPKPLAITRAGSTVALAQHGGKTLAYVADEDDHAVHVVDVDGAELSSTPLGGNPSQLMFLPDGRLVVALRDTSQLVVLEPTDDVQKTPLERRCTVATDAEPVGLALTPDDGKIVVTSGWGHSLVAYDARSPELVRKLDVSLPREPRGVVVSDDGTKAFVTHAVGGDVSIVDLEMKRVLAVPVHPLNQGDANVATGTRSGKAFAVTERANNAHSCQGFSLAKTAQPGGRVLFPQVLVDTGDVTTQPEGYGSSEVDQTELPDVAVVDASSGEVLPASLTGNDGTLIRNFQNVGDDHTHTECLLPRSAAYDATTSTLLVGCYGIDAVVAYDGLAASPSRAEKRRWTVAAGPSGIAVDPVKHRAVVWSQFERSLGIIALGGPEIEDVPTKAKPVPQIALAPTPQIPQANIALGRILFHMVGDVRISHDGRACASCHPDGRDDALTWATPNGPRRSILLAGRVAATAPFSWSGTEDSLKQHMGITFNRLKGLGGLKGLELSALASYIESLPPPPRSRTADARVARGSEIFHSQAAGCSGCHAGDRATDNAHHDVQSKTDSDKNGSFNTPSLRFVGGGGPYFHDGRYQTLRQLLTDADRKMGHTKQLPTEDLEALEAYLRSL